MKRGIGFGQITRCYACRVPFANKTGLTKVLLADGFHLLCSHCIDAIEASKTRSEVLPIETLRRIVRR